MTIACIERAPVLQRRVEVDAERDQRLIFSRRSIPTADDGCKRTAGCGLEATALSLVLDAIDYGVMVVDEQGDVVYANAAAHLECRDGGALELRDSRVRAVDAASDRALRAALRSAAVARRSLVLVAGRDGGLPVAIVPLSDGAAEKPATKALLILGRRELCQDLSVGMFARENRLTLAESRVLRALCAGLSVDEAARELGVAVSTLRTQVGSIRKKTNTDSLAHLSRRLAALPPVLSALHDPRPRMPVQRAMAAAN